MADDIAEHSMAIFVPRGRVWPFGRVMFLRALRSRLTHSNQSGFPIIEKG